MEGDRDRGSEILATFPVTLNLPVPDPSPLGDAAFAIKSEYRASVLKKRLRCLQWNPVTERDSGAIYSLRVGRAVEFDWTWEGAIAYRPGGAIDDDSGPGPAEEEMYWRGEVVEVDETSGRIFISIENPDQKPTTGRSFVNRDSGMNLNRGSILVSPRGEPSR
jgi:hypothetical protein